MRQIVKKITISIIAVVVGVICLWIGSNPSRHAHQIVPEMSFDLVVKHLGKPLMKEEKNGMALCSFRPNIGAAGPIKVGFDTQMKAVYLKIWEDAPPEWDLRKADWRNQKMR